MTTVTVNSFIEDTSVLVCAAFLFVRGRVEKLLHNFVASGIAFGLFGATETVFPNARFPYASHTLACAFAVVLLNWQAGAVTAITTVLAAITFLPSPASLVVSVQVGVTVLILFAARLVPKHSQTIAFIAVPIAQALALFVSRPSMPSLDSLRSPWTILANTFGVVILALVVRDARLRSTAEESRREADAAKRIAAEAQLAVLRARIQPHFLFNALNSIAALCQIDQERASVAAVRLGGLMRHSLETDFNKPHELRRELEIVKEYTETESDRFGPRLQVSIEVEGCEDLLVPAFSVQLLVENAILHGLSPKPSGGLVRVKARRKAGRGYVSVSDDGVGLSETGWKRDTLHGLGILEDQLTKSMGESGRIRLFRRPSGGTLAIMQVPSPRRIGR